MPFHRCTTKRSFCNQTRWVKLDADFPPSGSSLQAFPQTDRMAKTNKAVIVSFGSEDRIEEFALSDIELYEVVEL